MALFASIVATVVGGRFSVGLWRRWSAGGRVNAALLHWGISTAMFAVASLMLVGSELLGWSSSSFRVFYAFGAVLNVPWLALGSVLVNDRSRGVTLASGVAATVTGLLFLPAALGGSGIAVPGAVLGLVWGLLLLQPRVEVLRRGSVALLLVLGVLGTVAVALSDFRDVLPADGIPEGKLLFPPLVRGLAVGGNALGALVVVVSALASALVMAWGNTADEHRTAFRRRLRRAPVEAVAQVLFVGTRAARAVGVANLAAGNLLIALGVLIAAGSGGMFSFLGDTAGHAIGLGGGVAVMYAGFTKTLRTAVVEVTVYTRAGCGLCERAEARVRRESGSARVRVVDVDSSPVLQERHGVRVPVVEVDGREVAELELAKGVVRAAVRAATRAAA